MENEKEMNDLEPEEDEVEAEEQEAEAEDETDDSSSADEEEPYDEGESEESEEEAEKQAEEHDEDPAQVDPPAEGPKASVGAEKSEAQDTADSRYLRLESEVRAALKKMGINTDDVLDALATLGAEATGEVKDDYKRRRENEYRAEQAKRAEDEAANERIRQADLLAIKKQFPAAADFKSIKDLPNYKAFAGYRVKGLTATEAFELSHRSLVAEGIAKSVRQKSLNDTKQHMRSNVPKGAQGGSGRISNSDLAMYREMFPGASDSEISRLYKSVTK